MLTAGLGRALRRRGIHVAPFKAQNMSLQAAVTRDGGEIARAQWLQALACGLEPERRMNPVLVKPLDALRAQVVVMGSADDALSALPWKQRQALLWPAIAAAYDSLSRDHDLILIEGAGSPAEVNLIDDDLANLAIARHADAQGILVGDIDRGGVYAHLHGTFAAMPGDLQSRLLGFVLNKFRGDAALLAPAHAWLNEQTGKEVLAVLPWLKHGLPEEDSPRFDQVWDGACLNLAVIAYPHAGNVDDFDPLKAEPGVRVVAISKARRLQGFDAILLPGSRNVAGSLRFLRESGLDQAILAAAAAGIPVFGICGGLQILGERLDDPLGLETAGGETCAGLGLLPLATVLHADKQVRQARVACEYGFEVPGYEIHHGVTQVTGMACEHLLGGQGWRRDKITGVYLHGIFHDTEYRRCFLAELGHAGSSFDFMAQLQKDLDRLADALEASGLIAALLKQDSGLRSRAGFKP